MKVLRGSLFYRIHHIRLTTTNIQRLPAAVELGSALASQVMANKSRETEYPSLSSPVPGRTSHVTTKEKRFSWYSGVLGNVVVHTRTVSAMKSPEARESRGERVIVQGNTSWIKPSFVRYAFEVRYIDSYWRVPTALKVYAVLDRRAPVFEMCMCGDLEGLQVMFSSGSVSPFVIDEFGRSLLHVSTYCMYLDVAKCDQLAAYWLQADMFHMLLRLGVDVDLTSIWGEYDCIP